MSFAAITLCVASQRVFIVVVYFVMDPVRTLLDTLSYHLAFILNQKEQLFRHYIKNCTHTEFIIRRRLHFVNSS
jgi:uncharacterized membrane protein